MMNRLVSFIVFGLILVAPFSYSNYVQSTVYFTVATTISYTVTMPGGNVTNSANNSGGSASSPTQDVWFNSTTNDKSFIEPCTFSGSNCQVGSSNAGIYVVDNTGTANFTLWMEFSSALPTGVVVSMNSTVSSNGATGVGNHTSLYDVNNSKWAEVVRNLQFIGTNTTSIYLWANFSNVAAGSASRTLYLNSTLGVLG